MTSSEGHSEANHPPDLVNSAELEKKDDKAVSNVIRFKDYQTQFITVLTV